MTNFFCSCCHRSTDDVMLCYDHTLVERALWARWSGSSQEHPEPHTRIAYNPPRSPRFLHFSLQANLLSSHRSLVYRVETIALGDQPCDRGENVTLFLFNDCLEVTVRHLLVYMVLMGFSCFYFVKASIIYSINTKSCCLLPIIADSWVKSPG